MLYCDQEQCSSAETARGVEKGRLPFPSSQAQKTNLKHAQCRNAAQLDSVFQTPCFSDQHGSRTLFLPSVTAKSRGTCTLELLHPQMLGRWKKPERCSKIPWTTSLWHNKVQHALQVAKTCEVTGELPPGGLPLELSEAHTRLLQYTSEVPLVHVLTSSRSTPSSVRRGSPKSLSGEVKAI